jgi:transmembrane sensor
MKEEYLKKEDHLSIAIRKYVQGDCTREELREAISVLKDPKLDQRIETVLEEIWTRDQFKVPFQYEDRDIAAILNRIHQEIAPELKEIRRVKIRQRTIHIARIAAILVIGIFLGISIPKLKKTDPESYAFVAPKGSISQMILPDNTMVFLNSGSELKYVHSGSSRNREVFLNGEAWFQVTKDKKRPFVVHTGFYDVNVTGTEFNVNAYNQDNEIVTTLVEGSVLITSTGQFRINADISLDPGQQLVFNRDQLEVKKKNVEPKYFTSWKDNKLVFINMSLEDLVILLERKYGVDIKVADKSLLSYHYDGTIKNESILEIMELLKMTLPIQYKVVDQTIEITKKSGGK